MCLKSKGELTYKALTVIKQHKNDMKIGLQNFQGVAEYTKIPLAPITLFYGPNSAGKSTIVDALHFLSSVLKEGDSDWQRPLKRHARRDRMTCLIKGKHKGRVDDVVFTIEDIFKLSTFNECLKKLRIDRYAITKVYDLFFGDENSFEYQIFFSQRKNEGNKKDDWYIRKSILILRNEPIIVFSDLGLTKKDSWDTGIECNKGEISLNVSHSAFKDSVDVFDGDIVKALDDLTKHGGVPFVQNTASPIENEEYINNANADLMSWRAVAIKDFTISHQIRIDEVNYAHASITAMQKRFLGAEFAVSPADNTLVSVSRDASLVLSLINLLIYFPASNVAKACNSGTVSPIRCLPNEFYDIDDASHTDDLPWDVQQWNFLAKVVYQKVLGQTKILSSGRIGKSREREGNILSAVNYMLSSLDMLGVGYTLVGNVTLALDASDVIINYSNCSRKLLKAKLQSEKSKVHLYLIEQSTGQSVEIADVGVGISQIIPVLAASYMLSSPLEGPIVHIQQPEIHLHPKLQAQLADVFILAVNNARKLFGDKDKMIARYQNSYLYDEEDPYVREKYKIASIKAFKAAMFGTHKYLMLESHSEHLLLRFLRRIRETYHTYVLPCNYIPADGISNAVFPARTQRTACLFAEDVVVIYVKKDENNLTTFKHLRLAEDGEFIDRWPDGFFTERDKELFDEGFSPL